LLSHPDSPDRPVDVVMQLGPAVCNLAHHAGPGRYTAETMTKAYQ
jgi:hypothetical protein